MFVSSIPACNSLYCMAARMLQIVSQTYADQGLSKGKVRWWGIESQQNTYKRIFFEKNHLKFRSGQHKALVMTHWVMGGR